MPGVIPTYQSTTDVNTVKAANPSLSGASPIGQGLGDLARGIGSLGASLDKQSQIREQAEQKQADERAKVWAGQQAGSTLLDETQTMDEAQRKAPAGADGFTKTYLEGFDKRAAVALASAPDDASRKYLAAHLQAQRNHLGAEAQTFQFKSGDADVVNRYSDSVDKWGKVVDQDPTQFNAAMRVLGDTMPDVVPTARQKLVEHAKTNLTSAAAASVMNQNPVADADGKPTGGPYAVRDATNKALGVGGFTGPTGVPWVDAATPTQVRQWNDSAQVKIHQYEGNVSRLADARDKQAQKTLAEMTDLSDKGQYFDPPSTFKLLDDTKGTQYEPLATKLLDDQKNTAGFASGTSGQREASLEQMRGAGADPAKGTNPEDAKQLGKYQRINDAIQTAQKADPWEAATRYGVLKAAPSTPIASATDALKLVDGRLPQAGALESWTGGKVSPFKPEEAGQVANLVAKMPPAQAASFLGSLGDKIQDSDRVAAVAKQLGDKDGTIGIAMAMAGTQTDQGRYASELVLTGNQMVKDGTVKVDNAKETGWKADIAKAVRGAYANAQVEDQVVKAAFLIAAAKGGDTDQAVHLATGGGIIELNGSKVPMPVGFQADGQSGGEDRFRKALETIDPTQLMPQATDGKVYARGVPMAASEFLQKLPQAQLVMAGRNRNGGNTYAVKAGNSLVTNADNKPILIQIK